MEGRLNYEETPRKTSKRGRPDDLLEKVKIQVEDFLNQTEEARFLSERDRDYYDHKQWTQEEIAKLQSRNQAPIVVNRIRPKVEGLKGLLSMRQGDPKAYPRTKKHEKSAEAITDGLRYVADDNDFNDGVKPLVAEDFFIEGYGGAIIDVRQKKSGDIDIRIERIPWDRIYFDPHSRKKDFSDARYKGMILWMDADEVQEKFKDVDVDGILQAGKSELDGTFEDRPKWFDGSKKRIRVAMHFYIVDGEWQMCIFTGEDFLVEPQTSPFLDDDGEPCCPIELVSAYIDRENVRSGEVRGMVPLQDEINHRRSKSLHLLSQRQTFGRKGEVKDVLSLKRELAKPDGHIEFNGEQFGKDFGVLPTNDMKQGQYEFYQDAKAELDATSFNAQMSGDRQQGDLSGVAIQRLQQGGATEVNSLYVLLHGWEKRVFRQVWARIKQFWNEEKWIRVTDDQDSLRWVGLNAQVTAQEWLEEQINDASLPVVKRRQAAMTYKTLVEQQSPMLQQVADVRNRPAELDMDIILDQSFDTVNIQEEQFRLLAEFAKGGEVDIIELIELSNLRNKKALIEKIEKRREAQSQAAGNVAKIEAEEKQAKTAETMAKAEKTSQEALGQKIENILMLSGGTAEKKPSEDGKPPETQGLSQLAPPEEPKPDPQAVATDKLAQSQRMIAIALSRKRNIIRDPETREIVALQ